MKKGWFGPKRFGVGISPRSWEGWLVTALFVAGLALTMRIATPMLAASTGLSFGVIGFTTLAIWLALYVVVIWLTYEKTK